MSSEKSKNLSFNEASFNSILVIITNNNKTHLCRMTISVIKTAMNVGPAFKKKDLKSYIRNRETRNHPYEKR